MNDLLNGGAKPRKSRENLLLITSQSMYYMFNFYKYLKWKVKETHIIPTIS